MSNWLNEKNERVTKDTLVAAVPYFAAETTAWYAMRAILQEVQRIAKPQSYLIDLSQDFSLLHKYPADRFVYCIRETGTQIYLPPFDGNTEPLQSLKAHVRVFGTSCHWYTYDINDVRQGDDYNEPQLRACMAEEAYAYMIDVVLK